MGKLTTYMFIMSGLTLLFYVTGLLHGTANSALLNLLLSPEGIKDSIFSGRVLAALGLITTAAAFLSTFYVINLQAVARISITLYLLSIGWDFIAVYAVVASVNSVIALLLFSPLLLVFVLTMYEFFDSGVGER